MKGAYVEPGTRHIICQRPSLRVDGEAAKAGRFRWAGPYWSGEGWGPVESCQYFTTEERLSFGRERLARIGGYWVEVLVEVRP